LGYLIIGLILGITGTIVWQKQFINLPVFQQLMQRELVLNGQLGSITALKKKLEVVEKRLAEMESKTSASAEQPEVKPMLEVVSNNSFTGSKNIQAKNIDRRSTRGDVIEMWKAGHPLADIAAETRLGKGEVELIISLQSSAKKS
jgi:hypothetical protein